MATVVSDITEKQQVGCGYCLQTVDDLLCHVLMCIATSVWWVTLKLGSWSGEQLMGEFLFIAKDYS